MWRWGHAKKMVKNIRRERVLLKLRLGDVSEENKTGKVCTTQQ